MPAAAPCTSAARVGNSAGSLSCVAITTLSMGPFSLKRAPTRLLCIAWPRVRKRECCWRRGSQLGPPTGLHDVSSLVPRNPLRAHGSPLCSCFVRRPALGSFHGSLVRSRQTPAGARVLLAQPPCAGGRLFPPRCAPPRGEHEGASRRRRPRCPG